MTPRITSRRGALAVTALALAVGSGATVRAQGAPHGDDPESQSVEQRGTQVRDQYESPAHAGSVVGEVVRVDVPRGVLVMRTDEGEVRLRAAPNALRHAWVGHRLDRETVQFRGQTWLADERNPGSGYHGYPTHVVRGWIRSWDQPNGRITLATTSGDLRLSIHPSRAPALVEGSRVDVEYVEVEGQPWVLTVGEHPGDRPR